MPRSLPGTRIGNYVVVKLVGQGGMGEVYLVEHPDIGTRAAVKVLSSRFSSMAHATERFKAEARAIARIKHANVVEIHDYGTLEDGRLYYQMEHLEGEVLQIVMERRGKMSPEEIAPYLDQMCAGLGAAHKQHIVHRDLKPENIIVTAGPPMALKILDFGIAKLLETQPGSANTSVGVLLGTPIVMAPEQAAGQPERISFRTDLYSLGVILYWMLTGNPPFMDDAPGMLVSRHINDTPRALLDVDPTLPAGVAALVERCLAKAPEDRPASALEVAAEFSEALLWRSVGPSPSVPSAEDKTGIYVSDTGSHAVPSRVHAGPPPIPEEDDAESTAKTAVLPRLDLLPEGAEVEEIPTLRDDQEVKTMYVGEEERPRRLPVGWIVFGLIAAFLGVATGVVLSMTGGSETRPDAGAVAAAEAEADAGAGDPVAIALQPDSSAPDQAPTAASPPAVPDAAPPPAVVAPDLSTAAPARPQVRKRSTYKRRPLKRRWRRPRRPVKPRPPAPKPKVVEKAPSARVVVNVSSLHRDNFVTANIYLDGKYMGQTPLVMRAVKAGIHLVEARQKGYKRSSKQVRFVPGKINTVVMNLRK